MWLGIKNVIRANHMISLITSSTTDPSRACISVKKKLNIEIMDFHWFSNILLKKKIMNYELIDDFYGATFQQYLHMDYIVTNILYPWIWIINNIIYINTNDQLILQHGHLFQNFLCILFWINAIACIFNFCDYLRNIWNCWTGYTI